MIVAQRVSRPTATLTDTTEALETVALSACYGGTPSLRDVSLAIRRRSITALVGPSGCGKSTLLRALNRTLELMPQARVVAGAVLLEGQDIYARGTSASAVRTRIGILQQRPAIFPMSIMDNVLFGARYHALAGEPLEVARIHLERVGLWQEVCDRLNKPALALSGGQQQRLCLARTLAVQPKVILMDEPCSALDPQASATIESLARVLARDVTIVIVTHHLAQARRLAEACAFMLDGAIVAQGTPAAVLGRPSHPRIKAFVAEQT